MKIFWARVADQERRALEGEKRRQSGWLFGRRVTARWSRGASRPL